MDRTWINLVVKFVMLAVISAVLLPNVSNASIWQSLLIAAALTIVAFGVGDAYLLPEWGNTAATLADFGLGVALIWALGAVARTDISFGDALLVGAIVAAGEYFYHRYLTGEALVPQSPP